MKILITGDSITKGELGWNYVNEIIENNQTWEIVNLGLDGDTLKGIMKRTLCHIIDHDYDVIVIAAGHNDIILPEFEKMTFIHKMIVKQLGKRGSIPAEGVNEFKKIYQQFFEAIQIQSKATIVLTTLSVVNEDKNSSTAKMRLEYNEVIRKISNNKGLVLADVGDVFDSYLIGKPTQFYFMDKITSLFSQDLKKSANEVTTEQLSKYRNLYLTIDGVHINTIGATLYSQTIIEAIKKNIGD